MSPSDRETLLSFGFEQHKVDRALKAINSAGLQAALDWLEKYGDDMPLEEEGPADDCEVGAEIPGHGSAEAKGLKCMDCGKQFKNHALASYHGDKSGHSNFEETTEEVRPLTEQERQHRLVELRAKMEEKRAAKAKLELEQAKANEAIRRKGGKDLQKIQRELNEAQKEADKRKREKIEDAKARARVKQQIEEDKKNRADKAALRKSKQTGVPAPQSVVTLSGSGTNKPTAQSSASKTYTESRFQLRPPNQSQPIILTLKAEETLFDLASRLIEHPQFTDVICRETLRFSTAYPRKTFTEVEMSKTIKELGLMPSISLLVSYE